MSSGGEKWDPAWAICLELPLATVYKVLNHLSLGAHRDVDAEIVDISTQTKRQIAEYEKQRQVDADRANATASAAAPKPECETVERQEGLH